MSPSNVTKQGTKKGDKNRGRGGGNGGTNGGITGISSRFLFQPCLTGWAAHVSRSNITRISN